MPSASGRTTADELEAALAKTGADADKREERLWAWAASLAQRTELLDEHTKLLERTFRTSTSRAVVGGTGAEEAGPAVDVAGLVSAASVSVPGVPSGGGGLLMEVGRTTASGVGVSGGAGGGGVLAW